MKPILVVIFTAFAFAGPVISQAVPSLLSRGYTVLPIPQKVDLGANDFEFTQNWRIESGPGTAAAELSGLLAERFHLTLDRNGKRDGVLRLAIAPNTVAAPADVAEQAYWLTISSDKISITGNSPTGLYYGVQTFVQLLKEQSGKLFLPEVKIEDWPDLELRVIYWDDAHHLEHLEDLKAAIRQASFYKINGFSIKLEGHFQYSHAPAIVDPYALSPSELQELTSYGLQHYVQVIPYLDGPAHDAFILKHPEYASLRENAESNYEFCATNPKTYELFQGMFDDLLAANKGGKYFVLSTDEAYYVGLANNPQCQEGDRAKELGSVGKLLAEFVTKTAGYLHDHGRTVIFWGEYPLKPEDIDALPNYLVNGEIYGPKFDSAFRKHGIRQMVFTSTEGEEQLFPRYYPLPAPSLLHAGGEDAGLRRVQEMQDVISAGSDQADLLGVFVAGWADAGLHPETFWLGYATGPAAGWNRHVGNSAELQNSFYSLFYGRESSNMGRLYQLMSQGAQAWEDTWDKGPSTARKPIWGESYGQFNPPQPAHDQYLPLLPVPSAELLRVGANWRASNKTRLDWAGRGLAENDELLDLLYANTQRVKFNRYNMAVYLSIAGLYRQNLLMIQELGQIADLLKQAEQAAGKANPVEALTLIDQALDTAASIRKARNAALEQATATWYQSWLPRVPAANGRTYLHEVDDVKDHQPMRTIDMSYLVYRELLYPVGDWAADVTKARNEYAAHNGLPARDFKIEWKDTSSN